MMRRHVSLVCFYMALSCLLPVITAADVTEHINKLRQVAYANPDTPTAEKAWREVLSLDPKNLEAHVILGWSLITTPNRDEGVQMLEAAFDPERVSPTVDFKFPQTFLIAATIGRYRSQIREYSLGKKFTKLAMELGERHATPFHRVCVQMQLASMLDYFPESTEAADKALEAMILSADQLLAQPYWSIDDSKISDMPGAAPDPYIHCLLSLFQLSFYYRADVAAVASKHYEMAQRGWPALSNTADFVIWYDEEGEHPCIDRKIRLAVISGVITEGHSNSETFGGILSHLDRDIFEVTYVLLAEQQGSVIAEFTKVHSSDRTFIWHKGPDDIANGAWTNRFAKEIESWELDMIFYFDLTMSTFARRLGMQRLAPVQFNSPGHPITSGHDRSVMQYYLSWAAAELPLEEAQTHYTEELKLIPGDTVFSYFERRILPNEVSRMDGQAFGHLTRQDLGLPPKNTVYLCMQKPFKFHPEFDPLVCGIMKKDRDALVVLHKEPNPANQQVFERRLKNAGCELRRIVFLNQQPHHRLLALYREATVVLDSYPAGGDTTTREVLEMGKPIVTLPARLLGGRWSLAHMTTIGLKQSTMQALVANNPTEFVDLAVALASNETLRNSVEADIRESVKNLFQRQEAVDAWQELLLEISPYQRCADQRDEL